VKDPPADKQEACLTTKITGAIGMIFPIEMPGQFNMFIITHLEYMY
jgi:hypothetical protein